MTGLRSKCYKRALLPEEDTNSSSNSVITTNSLSRTPNIMLILLMYVLYEAILMRKTPQASTIWDVCGGVHAVYWQRVCHP
jgi:mannitol-specific phosphotransferase system IIBC component